MRLFADQCVHADLVEALRQQGHRIQLAAEAGLARADDDAIFHHAVKTSQILLTMDKDFGNIVRFDVRHCRGIVLIDIDRMSRSFLIRRALDFFSRTAEERLQGSLWMIGIKGIKNWPR